jgi:2-keto-3-deoxy-L-fuconate dehydrogenase
MGGRLAGKVAFVTAAGQGIGRATALAFADEGAVVWATDINEPLPAALGLDRPSIRARRLDVCDPHNVADCAAEVGLIDVMFTTALFLNVQKKTGTSPSISTLSRCIAFAVPFCQPC